MKKENNIHDLNNKFQSLSDSEKNNILENNNIIVDLLIKSSKITTIINMLLDYNNYELDISPIIEPKEYDIIINQLINLINNLNDIYKNKIFNKYKKTDNKKNIDKDIPKNKNPLLQLSNVEFENE